MREIDIFISYSRLDRAFVEKLAESLKTLTFSVWYDSDLHTGDEFVERINKYLERARIVLTIWSENSVSSKWVKAEALEGFHDDRFASIRIDDCKVPVPFNGSNYTQVEADDAFSNTKAFQKLAHSLAVRTSNKTAKFMSAVSISDGVDKTKAQKSISHPKRGSAEILLFSGTQVEVHE